MCRSKDLTRFERIVKGYMIVPTSEAAFLSKQSAPCGVTDAQEYETMPNGSSWFRRCLRQTIHHLWLSGPRVFYHEPHPINPDSIE